MKLTDKIAIRIYKRLKCAELVESIDEYPENERDGRDDLQFLTDEINYFRSCYEEDGHCFYESLNDARELLRETRNGKEIPLDPKTLKPKRGYYPSDIQIAKNVIAEYKQLLYYENQLKQKGYRGKW